MTVLDRPDQELRIKSQRCRALVDEARQEFRNFLDAGAGAPPAVYYRARNLLREAKAALEDTIKVSRRLLGPVPAYAAPEFEAWRTKTVEEMKLVLHGRDAGELKDELARDDLLAGIMVREDVASYVDARFDSQASGNRKVRNFKARMLIDRLSTLVREAEELQKQALKKQQGLL